MNNVINENIENNAASLLKSTNKYFQNIKAPKDIKNPTSLISPKGAK